MTDFTMAATHWSLASNTDRTALRTTAGEGTLAASENSATTRGLPPADGLPDGEAKEEGWPSDRAGLPDDWLIRDGDGEGCGSRGLSLALLVGAWLDGSITVADIAWETLVWLVFRVTGE